MIRYSQFAGLMICLLFSSVSTADDTASVDAIIDAYYEVISGPVGFVCDAERDETIHTPDAAITKFFWMALFSSTALKPSKRRL